MSNIDKRALREAAERAESDSWGYDRDEFNEALTPSTVLALLDELERANTETDKANSLIDEIRAERNFLQGLAGKRQIDLEATEKHIAEQSDYFSTLVALARTSADKAMRKFPQPNYVLLKVAEEAGEVVQAGVHYAENRMTWDKVEGEIVQLLAMLIRLVTEGDQINGVTPPQVVRAAGIGVKGE